jgi:hypothetical protein
MYACDSVRILPIIPNGSMAEIIIDMVVLSAVGHGIFPFFL